MSQCQTERKGLRVFFGDRDFYVKTAGIVIPIVIQNTISNVVSLLDNVMVGQVGTLQMSAVAIVNQLMFVFYLCIFGGMAGPGIFSTQYVGANDTEGVQNCFRIKLMIGVLMACIAMAIFGFLQEPLIGIYLKESGESASEVMHYAKQYLMVMMFGLLPFAFTNAYAMTLREYGETKLPMIASVMAILVNLLFNWILIFGHLGFPRLGVIGAAAATALSRYVECAIVVIATHRRKEKYVFIHKVYRTMKVPVELLGKIAVKGLPLLVNEFLWSSGIAAILACYSLRGIDAVAACNIASTVNNLFNVVFLSMGNAVAIMVGQALGAGKTAKAKELAWQLMGTAFLSCLVMGLIMFLCAPYIPHIYKTEAHVRYLASDLLRVLAVMMPFFSIPHCSYFTLRAGGKTGITFIFDCVYTWGVSYSCAWLLSHFTTLPILAVYACVQSMDILKGVIGIILVKKGIWIENIVVD